MVGLLRSIRSPVSSLRYELLCRARPPSLLRDERESWTVMLGTPSQAKVGVMDHVGSGKIRWTSMSSLLILVVDDEPDVEVLFRQRFRRDLRAGRFTMEFAQSGPTALQRISDAAGVSLILILSDINMPGMSGLELLPKAKALRPDVPVIMITAYGDAETSVKRWRTALRRF